MLCVVFCILNAFVYLCSFQDEIKKKFGMLRSMAGLHSNCEAKTSAELVVHGRVDQNNKTREWPI